MNNEEAIKMMEKIEQEIYPEKFNTIDEYLLAYKRQFYELFGAARDDDPEAVKEARSYFEIGIFNKGRDGEDSNILNFAAQRNMKQLLKYYKPDKAIGQKKGSTLYKDGFIEMEYDQIMEALTCSGN